MALHTGCSDQGTERKGGGDVPDLTAGNAPTAGSGQTAGNAPMAGASAESGAGGAAEGGSAGVVGSGLVPWCDTYKIINCVCQQCHQNPPLNGAPIPLMTYEDTQAPFPLPSSKNQVWQTMQTVIANRFMPYTGDPSVKPPVQPLTDEQQNLMLTWLKEGAHAEGGTKCSATCDWSDGTPDL
jgi:hypothetical protein